MYYKLSQVTMFILSVKITNKINTPIRYMIDVFINPKITRYKVKGSHYAESIFQKK